MILQSFQKRNANSKIYIVDKSINIEEVFSADSVGYVVSKYWFVSKCSFRTNLGRFEKSLKITDTNKITRFQETLMLTWKQPCSKSTARDSTRGKYKTTCDCVPQHN